MAEGRYPQRGRGERPAGRAPRRPWPSCASPASIASRAPSPTATRSASCPTTPPMGARARDEPGAGQQLRRRAAAPRRDRRAGDPLHAAGRLAPAPAARARARGARRAALVAGLPRRRADRGEDHGGGRGLPAGLRPDAAAPTSTGAASRSPGRGEPPAGGDLLDVGPGLLRRTANHRLLATGLAYPTYYLGLPAELRAALTDGGRGRAAGARAVAAGRHAGRRRGRGLTTITDDAVLLPKLFRRLADFLHLNGEDPSLAGFAAYLTQRDDRVLVLDGARSRRSPRSSRSAGSACA